MPSLIGKSPYPKVSLTKLSIQTHFSPSTVDPKSPSIDSHYPSTSILNFPLPSSSVPNKADRQKRDKLKAFQFILLIPLYIEARDGFRIYQANQNFYLVHYEHMAKEERKEKWRAKKYWQCLNQYYSGDVVHRY